MEPFQEGPDLLVVPVDYGVDPQKDGVPLRSVARADPTQTRTIRVVLPRPHHDVLNPALLAQLSQLFLIALGLELIPYEAIF